MNKSTKTIISLTLLLILTTLITLQMAMGFMARLQSVVTVTRSTANRCDHEVNPPSTGDAWTAVGIAATFRDGDQQWLSATYYFRRAFGAYVMSPHDWTIDGSMTTDAIHDYTDYYTYQSTSPTWQYQNPPKYTWAAYYHDVQQYQSFDINSGFRVGANCGTWFKLLANPNTRVYISSIISSADMIAANPNYQG